MKACCARLKGGRPEAKNIFTSWRADADLKSEVKWVKRIRWGPIYRLAERFRVSGTMMRVRLEKLGLIEIGADGKPRPKPKPLQHHLFH
jgi:hypothetical protein